MNPDTGFLLSSLAVMALVFVGFAAFTALVLFCLEHDRMPYNTLEVWRWVFQITWRGPL